MSVNPYAPPRAELEVHAAEAGFARDGRRLIAPLADGEARLPARCIRCDGPAHGEPLQCTRMHMPPAWAAAQWIAPACAFLLVGFVLDDGAAAMLALFTIFALVALVARASGTRVRIYYHGCRLHAGVRRAARGVFWALQATLFTGIGLQFAGIVKVETMAGVAMLLLLLLILAAIVQSVALTRRITAVHIDGGRVWLSGFAATFVESFPAAHPDSAESKSG